MLFRKLFIGAAFATAIAVTAIFTSFAASSAYAGAGNFAIERPIPNYLMAWENPLNPLLPQAPVTPIFGR